VVIAADRVDVVRIGPYPVGQWHVVRLEGLVMADYCAKCGQKCVPSARYCAKCGHRLSTAPNEEPDVVIQQANVYVEQPYYEQRPRLWSPLVACLFSLLIPGLGQLYKGNPFSGFTWFMLVCLAYCLFTPFGVLMHLLCVIFATLGDPYG